MPSMDQLRGRLLKKLKELFQLDQPDLDFGFYRIMHAKSQQISEFIKEDLLKIVNDAFGQIDDTHKAELQVAYEKAIETAKGYGAPDPENTSMVKDVQARLDAVKDTASAEADIYDHLYRFFERYYDDGDFISRRYYTRETSGKAAPFAVPYNGEEVKLHWANADQYYIKTAEYFNNFTFDLRQAKEVHEQKQLGMFVQDENQAPLHVHFRIVEAAEGEHGNIKESEAKKRFFIIHAEKPVEFSKDGELVVNFEYGPDPEKSGQEKSWRDKRNAEAVETIFKVIEAEILELEGGESSFEDKGDTPASKHLFLNSVNDYLRLLKLAAPTESDKKRVLLAKYIKQYTARNTMDYFIHKGLGGFLHRELDFYIKNEVMRIDDIENADAPTVESYLAKIKVLRKIAGKLIDFLAQLENFQKKLWLKKKFIVETNYCITLDRVPEDLYPEIAANQAQHDEWVSLFAIDEIKPTLFNPGYSKHLTEDFLKANNKLVLDTRFFDDVFKARLIASIPDLDEQCDGLLIHSENFQALNLLQERYREQVKCIYIDPPYNTDASAIIYKNDYKDSSWLCLMENRVSSSYPLLINNGIICVAIDDEEVCGIRSLLASIYQKQVGIVTVRSNPAGRKTKGKFAPAHEYALFFGKSESTIPCGLSKSDKSLARYPKEDANGRFAWANFIRSGNNDKREDRPKLFYPIFIDETDSIRIPKLEWLDSKNEYVLLEQPRATEVIVYPIQNKEGKVIEKNWQRGHTRVPKEIEEYRVRRGQDGTISIDFKTRMDEDSLPITWWDDNKYASANYGALELKELFRVKDFDFPKAKHLVSDCIKASGIKIDSSTVLDFFAGSGTTGHAVINLNREDGGKRKYILVEMGDYFDTVLKPRIAKVVYSVSWKNGKPTVHNAGISHCFKYLRLESYEDTLNNLRFDENPTRDKAISANSSLKEDFMLHYLLDVETRGSQSLLNIDAFTDPTAYTLKVKKPGSDEYMVRNIDLMETFNYLIGLRIVHMAVPQSFTAAFKRLEDPEVPKNQKTKLVIDGKIKQIKSMEQNKNPGERTNNSIPSTPSVSSIVKNIWWFRKVEGWVPKDPSNPDNGQREKVLIVWRKLTGDMECDNLMLDEWFRKNRISTRDFEFDTIYVNGSNNLPNLALAEDKWKVRLIEEEFMKRMWDTENV